MDKKTLLTYSALLHDIGKIISRSSDKEENHRKHGRQFLAQFDHLHSDELLENIYYHDKASLQAADVAKDSVAYLIALANEIAIGIDRPMHRDNGQMNGSQTEVKQYEPLHSIFNLIQHIGDTSNDSVAEDVMPKQNERGVFPFQLDNPVPYPTTDKITYTNEDYKGLQEEMKGAFEQLPRFDDTYFASVLQWTEQYWTQIPHDVRKDSLFDISLYDHSKMTCALATCLYEVLEEKSVTNYRDILFSKGKIDDYYTKDLFLLTSLDMSGIQDFIYSISGENALKSLRTRSFYIELMLEVIVDELLTKLELPRTNLLYTGGGHAYLLLPNTSQTKTTIANFHDELKSWFLRQFTTDLSVSIAYVPSSSADLMNTNGKYREVWQKLTSTLAARKSQKYNASDIRWLNDRTSGGERECKECLRSDTKLNKDDRCQLCERIIHISNQLRDDDYFIVSTEGSLAMPFEKYLSVVSEETFNKGDYEANSLRYTKNKESARMNSPITANLWMCDYDKASSNPKTRTDGIASYANREKGIKRLGVVRADVDNLGMVFVNGIADDYLSLSRTVTLSRQLSMFFKYELRRILRESTGSEITVIYSGGDDIFLIGAWDHIVEKSVEIRKQFAKFTMDTLSFSAGIGLYQPKYPVAKMAEETGILEEAAKAGDKDQVTLWNAHRTYNWEVFDREILQDKLPFIKKMFQGTEDHGKTFAYHMLNYFTEASQINIARLAYLLARSKIGDSFSQQIFTWVRDEDDRHYFITALEYYIYEIREVQ